MYFLCFTIFVFAGCDSNRMYEDVKLLPTEGWPYDSVQVFNFPVNDIQQSYNLSLALRHSINYAHHNIYLWYQLFDPSGKVLKSSMLEGTLMDPKTGEPYGLEGKATGQGSALYYSHLLPVSKNHKFLETGNYQLLVKHYMRTDTLQNIMAVGIILDKQPVN